LAAFGLIAVLLLIVLAVETIGVAALEDPTLWLGRGGAVAAAVGVGLLLVDVLLPVPSSLVMVLHGAVFGVVVGTGLSLVGSVGAALVGFGIGRRGAGMLGRFVPAEERARADWLLERWGALAIMVTRPVPLLAEATAILAGASPMPWGRAALAALLGTLPAALLYAVVGATAASAFHWTLAFVLVLPLAGLYYALGRWLGGWLRVKG
jgi:uncharacterized membrane protein YdjX (TVP38/TMEM64 family)